MWRFIYFFTFFFVLLVDLESNVMGNLFGLTRLAAGSVRLRGRKGLSLDFCYHVLKRKETMEIFLFFFLFQRKRPVFARCRRTKPLLPSIANSRKLFFAAILKYARRRDFGIIVIDGKIKKKKKKKQYIFHAY